MDAGAFQNEYDLQSLTLARPEGWQFSMQVTPRYLHCYGDKPSEPFSSRLASSAMKNARLFIDVGAHYGFYTLMAGSKYPSLEVMAIEPVPENFEILQRNVAGAGLSNVKLHPAAASDADGKAELNISMASDNCSFYPHPNAPPLKKVSVLTIRIDSLLGGRSPCPTFIKIDTDGHELAVLRGMTETLDRFPEVKLLIEFNPKMQQAAGHEPEALLRELDRLGFAMFLLDEARFLPLRLQPAANWKKLFASESYANLYCVRKEHALSVCFFSHSAEMGGAERSLLELARELVADHGAVCSVVVPGRGPLIEEMRRAGIGVIESFYPMWCQPSSVTIPIDFFEHLRPGALNLLATIMPDLAHVAPDIIVTQTIVIPWGAVAASLLDRPHVWSVCEYGEKDHHLSFSISFTEVIQSIVDCSSLIFTNSDAVGHTLFPALGPEKRRTLYRHVPMPHLPREEKPTGLFEQKGAVRLGLFGTLIEGKGQEDAVLAVARLIAAGRDVELLLAGDSSHPYRKVLERLVEENGLAERVQIPGFLSNPYPAMQEVDIHVVCSRNEAFGRSAVEAMLLGKPVIYPAAGGIAEYMIDGRTGLSYPPGDSTALAERIAILIDHPEQRVALGKDARAFAEDKFTPDSYGGEFYRTVLKLLAADARPPSLTSKLKVLMDLAHKERARAAKKTALRELLDTPHNWWKSLSRRRRFIQELKIIEASDLFNRSWYLQQNPDVAAAKVDPLHHYLQAGAREGRNPNPVFNTAMYSRQHPEIASEGINPFVHYLLSDRRARP